MDTQTPPNSPPAQGVDSAQSHSTSDTASTHESNVKLVANGFQEVPNPQHSVEYPQKPIDHTETTDSPEQSKAQGAADATPTPESLERAKADTAVDESTPIVPFPLKENGANGAQKPIPSIDSVLSRSANSSQTLDKDLPSSETTLRATDSPTPSSKPPTPPTKNDVLSSGTPRSSISQSSEIAAQEARPPSVHRSQSSGQASPGFLHKRSITVSKGNTVSVVLISTALETIAASREAKRSAPLKESVQRALEMVRSGEGGDKPRVIFEPLRLACETRNEKLMIASLDCIAKLIAYSFFVESSPAHSQNLPSPPPSPGPNGRHFSSSQQTLPEPSLVDIVVHTITTCHTENTPDTVLLQIVKALLALVLSTTLLVHQSSLLKAVRTVYNIFIVSNDPVNQMVAQGGLTQIVNHVFARCKIPDALPETVPSTPKQDGPELDQSPRTPGSVSSLPGVTTPTATTTAESSPQVIGKQISQTPSTEPATEPSAPAEGTRSHVQEGTDESVEEAAHIAYGSDHCV